MGIELYREFITFSRFLNVTRAAEELNLSPSTLSRHLSALEGEIGGGPLFVRIGGGLVLTPVGSVVLRGASAIVAEYQTMSEHVAQLRTGTVSMVRVSFALDDRTIIDRVSVAKARLKGRFGNLNVQLRRSRGKGSREALANDEVDIIIDYDIGPGEPASEALRADGLEILPLAEDSVVIALPAGTVELGRPVLAGEICGRFIPWPSAAVDNYLDQVLKLFSGCRHQPGVRFIDAANMDEFFLHVLDDDEMWPFSRHQYENYRGSIPRSYLENCDIHELADRDTTFRRHAVWRRDNPNPLVPLFARELGREA